MKHVRIRARSQKRDRIENLMDSIIEARRVDEEHLYLHELDAQFEEAVSR